MKKIIVISLIVSFVAALILEILIKMNKIENKGKSYNTISLVTYTSIVVLILSISYVYTDTVMDFILGSLSLLMILILMKIQKIYVKDTKYNWRLLFIITIGIYGCYVLASSFMLFSFDSTPIFAIIGASLGGSIKKNIPNYKKMIISGILSFVIILSVSLGFGRELRNISKPLRYTIKRVESEGYEINDEDYIYSNINSFSQDRYEPINIYIIRFRNNDITRKFSLTYYKDAITEFKVK